jgi:phage-related protein
MAEKIGTIYYDLDLDDSKYKSKSKAAGTDADTFGSKLQGATVQMAALGAAAGLALNQVVNWLEKSVDAAVKQQNALMGLSSVARGTGNDIDKTTNAAKQLASDGLMPLGDAASGLKNLLAAGFSLPEAIKLMERFKDSAAFGRQGSLEFGQAIVGATEGIKNGNSALVDNAGVTKNLSNMLVDAGYSAQDLAKAGDDVGVRMAIYNGIIKETANQQGDAAKLSDSFGGALARQKTEATNLQVALGTALQPMLTKIMEAVTPLIEKFSKWVKENPRLVAAIAAVVVVLLGLLAIFGIVGAAIAAFMAIGTVGVVAAAVAAGIALLVGIFIYFGDTIKAVAQTVGRFIGSIVQWFKDHFDTIKKVVLTVLAVAFAPLIATVLLIVGVFKLLVWIVQTVATIFMAVFNAIWAVVQFVFNGIMMLWNTILAPVFNAIMFILGALFQIWWTIFTGILQVVWTIVSTIAQIIFVVLMGVFNWILNTFLKPLFNFYVAIFTAIWNVISTVFNAIWNVITMVAGAIWNTIVSVFNAVLNFVRGVFNWIKDAIISPIVAAYNRIAQIVGGIKDAVVGGIRSAIDGIKNFVGDAINAGKNLIDGIVKGVAGAKDAVVNKVKEIASGALDAVKKFFGIKSPSRVMAQMGDFMMQGMQNGIERAGSAVVKAATTISGKISDGMQDSLSNVSQGARNVVGVYRGMYGQLNAMNMQSAGALAGSMTAIGNAANENPNGAIAQPPVNVTLEQSGIVARSRSEFREIIADGIEAVNEDLRARGYNEIGDGKVKGMSTT